MANPRFQLISDLHLETPIQAPSYSYFSDPANFPLHAPNLFLLGDIGLVAHTQPLLLFLRSLLNRDIHLRIFYVMGNHEPYTTTLENAIATFKDWEKLLNMEFEGRFHFLDKTRVDIDSRVTILGCTLWSHVPAHHAYNVITTVKGFRDKTGIWDRSLGDHNADHALDLWWLNANVRTIEEEEPEREIIILTHHSPTTDPRANSKRFPPERSLNSAFRTDLSSEKCWMSPSVKVWAFGHTHFSCQFVDEGNQVGRDGKDEDVKRRKLVVANQKGYAYAEGEGNWNIEPMVVGREDGVWRVVVGEKEGGEGEVRVEEKPKISVRGELLTPINTERQL